MNVTWQSPTYAGVTGITTAPAAVGTGTRAAAVEVAVTVAVSGVGPAGLTTVCVAERTLPSTPQKMWHTFVFACSSDT